MFDKYFYNTSKGSSYSRVDITEKKAPTDESIKLLRELEQTAQDNIIKAIKVENNVFNGVVVHLNKESFGAREILYIKFNFNGKEYIIKQEINEVEFVLNRHNAFRLLAEGISSAIFNELNAAVIETTNKASTI